MTINIPHKKKSNPNKISFNGVISNSDNLNQASSNNKDLNLELPILNIKKAFLRSQKFDSNSNKHSPNNSGGNSP